MTFSIETLESPKKIIFKYIVRAFRVTIPFFQNHHHASTGCISESLDPTLFKMVEVVLPQHHRDLQL